MTELKDRLREALEMRNMRPVELSEKTGVPKGAISYYLAGKSQPKADRLYHIGKALDVNEAWLMGYDVPAERTDEQKKSDVAVNITRRLGADRDFLNIVKRNLSDPEYFELSKLLYNLDADQLASVKNMLGAFSK